MVISTDNITNDYIQLITLLMIIQPTTLKMISPLTTLLMIISTDNITNDYIN